MARIQSWRRGCCGGPAGPSPGEGPAHGAPPAEETALRRLVSGFGQFRHQHFEVDEELFSRLLEGQHPEVMVIACSDSRTDPAIICGARPGDLFVVRNVAALVPPPTDDGQPHGTASAIEFGVKALGMRHVVVLGHSFCAGVRCLLEHDHGARRFDYVSDWVEVAREVREEMDGLVTDAERAPLARRAEQATLLASLRNLAAYPFVAERVAAGSLSLHGWYFHFGWGVLQAASGPRGPFRQLDPDDPLRPAIGGLQVLPGGARAEAPHAAAPPAARMRSAAGRGLRAG